MTIFINHDNCYTIKRFLKLWGGNLRGQVRLIYYADLVHRCTLPREVAIFTDVERLSAPQIELAAEAASQLRDAGVPVLNDPARVLRRYDLLRTLHAEGLNPFTVFRLSDDRSEMRFPAFLRLENEHQGSLSELLQNEDELSAAIEKAIASGLAPEELLIVEFCDTADEGGLIRKYAAAMIGEQFIPRHLLFSRKWLLKKPDLVDAEKAREENEYLEASPHPHEAQLRAIFAIAGIEYGRIDYSVQNGKVVTWEINTNPSIVPEAAIAPERMASQMRFRDRTCAALREVNEKHSGSTPVEASRRYVKFQPSRAAREKLGVQPLDFWLHPARRAARPLGSQRARRILRKLRVGK